MSLLLSIDTAGSACAVALSRGEEITALRVLTEPRVHAAKLAPTIRDLAADHGGLESIDAIAVSKGPGSYTGLRIGVSTAKGLAFALDVPLVGVQTFEALALANVGFVKDDATLATTAPSRRNEVYWQMWSRRDDAVVPVTEPVSDRITDVKEALEASGESIVVLGEGSGLLGRTPPADARPAVRGVAVVGADRIRLGQVEDVISFEPYYLKEFVAKKPGSPFERLSF